jgi:RNA ligase (TIGR02306 family)
MRQLASIQKIYNITDIETADKLQVASVLGWKVVIEKNKYKENDLVVFCEIDSILPDIPVFEFMRQRHFRVKTIRLRGQLSQGLVMPMSILEGKKFPDDVRENPVYNFKEGDSVTSLLGVTKFEPPQSTQLFGHIKRYFPVEIQPKTDETRIQILDKVVSKYQGIRCYITEKIDGSSITIFYKDGEFGVCSRNLELKETEDNAFWKWVRFNDVENRMKKFGKNISIQGELFGPGICCNRLRTQSVDALFFNVYDIDNQKYYGLYEFVTFITALGLKTVPILDDRHIMLNSIDKYLDLAIGKSMINTEVMREGIVIRPVEEIRDDDFLDLERGRVSFKAINNEYLLKHNE